MKNLKLITFLFVSLFACNKQTIEIENNPTDLIPTENEPNNLRIIKIQDNVYHINT